MTKEEKQLLFKDLCGRLPYGIKGEIYLIDNELEKSIGKAHPNPTELHPFNLNLPDEETPFIIKPYLRPMSSMTEEETDEYDRLVMCNASWIVDDWLLAHHFDFRKLIQKGLALEAPEGMYKNE
jgi:hypothetical protein